jgi:WD40 repeat protein
MSTIPKPSSPYKGLFPYAETDASLFFGREKDTRIIISNLFAVPLTLLYGMSGVGKSSVLRAGVAHQTNSRDDIIVVVFSDWEESPLEGLKKAVSKTMEARFRQNQDDSTKGPSTSETLSKFLLGWASLLKCRLAIILDQFEDYLLFQAHPQFVEFADEFATAVRLAEERVSFLISIREDSLARLDYFDGSIPILFDNYLRLEHLDWNAGKAAIVKPIKCFNDLYLTDSVKYDIEPELVEAVLKQVRIGSLARGSSPSHVNKDQAEKYHLDTVFLQLVMRRLWDREVLEGSHVLRLSTLDSLGGPHQIFQAHFDEVMEKLGPGEKSIAAKIFKYLVSPSGTKIDYPVHELFPNETVNKNKLSAVLNKLSQGSTRILRRVAPPGLQTEGNYEIFHEALGPAILDWMTRYVRSQEKAATQAALEMRNLVIGIILLSVLAILLLMSIIYTRRYAQEAINAQNDAVRQKNEADRQRTRYEKTLKIINRKELALPFTKAVMSGHTDVITSVAFSPNNKYIVTGSNDGTAKVWDVNDGSLVVDLFKHDGPVKDVAFSPDGSFIATASEDKTARIWDINGVVRASLNEQAPVTSISFSLDGQRIVTASEDKTASIWAVNEIINRTDPNKPVEPIKLIGHQGVVRTAEFSSDGNWVLTASDDSTAAIWDARTGQLKRSLIGHARGVVSAKFSHNMKLVVTASLDGTARIWDSSSGKMLNVLKLEASVNSVEFNNNDDLVVTASSDGTARVWDAGKFPVVYKTLSGHTSKVNTARFSSNAELIVTASNDRTARIWDTATGKQLVTLRGHLEEVNSAIFSSDDSLVATVSNDQTARVYDANQFGRFQVSDPYVEPINYQGPCPASVRLNGRIVVAEGKGEIRYRFLLGDKMVASGQTVIDSVGTIYLAATLFSKSSLGQGKLVLEITEPNHVKSEAVPFKFRCHAKPAEAPAQPEDTP